MADRPDDGNGRVTIALLGAKLDGIEKKLDMVVADHDILVRQGMQVTQNKDDIALLCTADRLRRRESFAEMVVAAIVGASAWLKP